MTEPLDHIACSALLRAYVAGEAGEAEPEIATHLERCEQCRAEHRVLEMMLRPVDPPTTAERARLRAGVMRGARSRETAPARVAPDRVRSRRGTGETWRRVRSRRGGAETWRVPPQATALWGAAAAVVLVVAAIALFHPLMGTSSSPSGGGAAGVQSAHVAATPSPRFVGAPSGPQTDRQVGPPAVSIDQVQREAAPVLADLAGSYRSGQVSAVAGGFLDRLVRATPANLAAQVQECGQNILRTDPAIPAFGATEGEAPRSLLVLVFAAPGPGDRLTQSQLYAWPLGSCDQPLIHRSAPISPTP